MGFDCVSAFDCAYGEIRSQRTGRIAGFHNLIKPTSTANECSYTGRRFYDASPCLAGLFHTYELHLPSAITSIPVQ